MSLLSLCVSHTPPFTDSLTHPSFMRPLWLLPLSSPSLRSLIPAAPLPGSGSDTRNHSFTLFTPRCLACPHRCSARTHTPLYGSGPQCPAHSVSLPLHSRAHLHTHTSGELLVSVLTSHLLLSCQGQRHAVGAMPSRGKPPTHLSQPLFPRRGLLLPSLTTRVSVGVCLVRCLSVLHSPSHGVSIIPGA